MPKCLCDRQDHHRHHIYTVWAAQLAVLISLLMTDTSMRAAAESSGDAALTSVFVVSARTCISMSMCLARLLFLQESVRHSRFRRPIH